MIRWLRQNDTVIAALNAVRKNRLRVFGLHPSTAMDVARLRLRVNCACADCELSVMAGWRQLEAQAREADDGRLRRFFRPTATVINLQTYQSFESYRKEVSKETKGKYHRSAQKARRLGYTTRRIGNGAYFGGIYGIRASKMRRSKGVVWEAQAGPRPDIPDLGMPFVAPACPEHWRIDWGAFRAEANDERLFGFASLLRAGNQVQVSHFMGHGEALTDGVTKLLMFDIMDWLLARDDLHVQGLDFLFYGTVEEGDIGLLNWKRYTKFKPALISCPDPPLLHAPAQFDRALYLELNPDVAMAGVDPYKHYLLHGMFEGRKTTRD